MSERDGGFRGWLSVAGAGTAFFAQSGAAVYSFGALLPWLCMEYNWTRGDVSVALSICMILSTLTAPVAGFLIARYGALKAIIGGDILIALAFLGLAFQSALWQLYAAYAAVGVGTGLAGLVAANTVASNWFVKRTSLAMSVATGSGGMGGLVLVPIITLLISGIGLQHTYLVLFVLMLVLGVVVPMLIVRNRPEGDDGALAGKESPPEHAVGEYLASPDVPFDAAFRRPVFWLLTAWGCAFLFVFLFFTAHQIAYLTGSGLSSQMAALTMGILSGASVAGTIVIGVLSLKYSLRMLAILASGVIMVAILLAFMVGSAPFLAFVFSILFGVGFGAVLVCLMGLLSAHFGRAHFSKIFGVSSLFGIVGTLGPPMGGFLFDKTGSYRLPLMIAVGSAALGMICIISARAPLLSANKTEIGSYGGAI